jgi:hypothetical protein
MINNYIYDYIKNLLDKNNIVIANDKTCKYLTDCIENIIFNVVSIAAIITFINNCKTIHKQSIEIIRKYLNNMCGSTSKILKGGGGSIVLPSEFYGVNSNRYSISNGIQTDILNVDFNNGLLRPQIGGGKSKSNSNKSLNVIYNAICEILEYYKLKASKETKNKITKLIEKYISCLIMKLKEEDKKISLSIVKKILKSNKLFDIFK